jgi:FAD synthase
MKIFRSFGEARNIRNPVVTTGSFDGVHIGHKTILNRLNILAAKYEGESVLITFDPHPRKVLYPETAGKDLKLINSQEKYNFEAEEIPEQEVQHETVSSTKIRRAIGEGYIQRANACLDLYPDQKISSYFHKKIHGAVNLHDGRSIQRINMAKEEILELIY